MSDFENVNKEFLYKRAALKWAPWAEAVISLSVADIDFPASRDIKEGVIRAVNDCDGLGTKAFFDPDLIVPNPLLSLKEGAILPWKKRGESFLLPILEALAKQYRFNVEAPFARLPKSAQHLLLYGSEGEKGSFRVKRKGRSHLFRQEFEGVIRELERRSEDDGEEPEALEAFMNVAPCPECGGTRLKKEVLSIKVGGRSIAEVTHLYVKEALEFVRHLELTLRSQKIAQGVLNKFLRPCRDERLHGIFRPFQKYDHHRFFPP